MSNPYSNFNTNTNPLLNFQAATTTPHLGWEPRKTGKAGDMFAQKGVDPMYSPTETVLSNNTSAMISPLARFNADVLNTSMTPTSTGIGNWQNGQSLFNQQLSNLNVPNRFLSQFGQPPTNTPTPFQALTNNQLGAKYTTTNNPSQLPQIAAGTLGGGGDQKTEGNWLTDMFKPTEDGGSGIDALDVVQGGFAALQFGLNHGLWKDQMQQGNRKLDLAEEKYGDYRDDQLTKRTNLQAANNR